MEDLLKLKAALTVAAAAAEAEATAASGRIAGLNVEQDAVAVEIARLTERRAALRAECAVIDTAALTAEWMRRQSDVEAVERTIALLRPSVPAVEPEPVVEPEPESTPEPEFTPEPVVDSLTYPDAILAVLERNPHSTKQWALTELSTAVAKLRGLPDSPLTRQRVSTAVERMVLAGRVRAKHSDARGKRVYSTH